MHLFAQLRRFRGGYGVCGSSCYYPNGRLFLAIVVLMSLGIACTQATVVNQDLSVGESPGIVRHVTDEDLSHGSLTRDELIAIGKQIFTASFNTLDGSGNSKTRLFGKNTEQSKLNERFNRISGPDANACSGCHNMPIPGGGGDNVANVFVLAREFPNVNFDGGPGDLFESLTLTTVGNERGTVSMFGSGFIELLAREMTTDLQEIRNAALQEALLTQRPATVAAQTKGVSFGKLTVWPDGLVDTSNIEGIDEDLIVKPFGQKGVYTSLREFTLDALETHHGLQGEERSGTNKDADQDGIFNELTIADTTALTLFQAALPPPSIREPTHDLLETYVERGEILFDNLGCAVCHKPYLELNSPIYSEPNPFNPPGTLSDYSIPDTYSVDLFENASSNTVRRTERGTYLVYAYTDLKRHDMGPILANETIEQRFVDSAMWITRKLWGMVSEPPFLHHGRATLIEEAIVAHGGEADSSRASYENLSSDDKAALIEFIKTFQMSVGP
ncbi:hypothetical protein FIM08_00240 [SAR202 cluster bacterium AC-647-N09_OGT_505m]|nr:hypothetical protein [SAR202 cluster bacterium AC-647-N09_OGT_505m]